MKSVASAVFTLAGRAWRSLGELVEMISHIGHGPRRWVEDSEIENPYAGAGPVQPGHEPHRPTPDS